MNEKVIVIAISLLITTCLMPTAFYGVQAADNDNFDVTMSGAYLECNIINASWAIGTVQMSTSYWTNETSETQEADVTNCTQGTNIDFEMVVSGDATTWHTVWAENFTTGADQYKLNATDNTWSTQAALNITTYADVALNHDPVADIAFDLRFDSPTSTTTGVQQTITLNGKVTVH